MSLTKCEKCNVVTVHGGSGRCLKCGTAGKNFEHKGSPCVHCPNGVVQAGYKFCPVCELPQDTLEGISLTTLGTIELMGLDMDKVKACCATYGQQTFNGTSMNWDKVARLLCIIAKRRENSELKVFTRCLGDSTAVIGLLKDKFAEKAASTLLRNMWTAYTGVVSERLAENRAAVKKIFIEKGIDDSQYYQRTIADLQVADIKDLTAEQLKEELKVALKPKKELRITRVKREREEESGE